MQTPHSRGGGGVVPVSQLKAHCLGLVEEVRRKRRAFVITKRGQPVAQLVPFGRTQATSPQGMWSGIVEITGDIIQLDWSQEFEASREP